MSWFRHGVDTWHLDCNLILDKHDFIASITRTNETFLVQIPDSSEQKAVRQSFDSTKELNEYLTLIGLEQLKL